MTERFTRRTALTYAGALGGLAASGCLANRPVRHVSGRLRHACIGVGGMGRADAEQIASHPEVDIVALCDVDQDLLDRAKELYPEARTYRDWRALLEDEAGNIDSVNVTTPDHMHAVITLSALAEQKHVYCQKPLTRTVAEARAVAAAARRTPVVTQMGIQNRSKAPYRSALQLFRENHIGKIHQVHVWSDRPAGWWPQGVGRPEGSDPVPDDLAWDLWLGVAPGRPFKEKAYHPFVWRGWEDFGTGAQGDMACHLMDPAFWFLGLGAPTRIRSEGPPPNGETYPLWSTVHYEFEPNEHTTRGPLLFTWYDGGRKPPRSLLADLGVSEPSPPAPEAETQTEVEAQVGAEAAAEIRPTVVPANGCLFVGTEGALLADPYAPPQLLAADRFAHVEIPEGQAVNHWHQWVDACRGQALASAPFEYSAHLTEVALLGNVALRFPHETLVWNAKRMRFPDRPAANRFLSSTPRQGWG